MAAPVQQGKGQQQQNQQLQQRLQEQQRREVEQRRQEEQRREILQAKQKEEEQHRRQAEEAKRQEEQAAMRAWAEEQKKRTEEMKARAAAVAEEQKKRNEEMQRKRTEEQRQRLEEQRRVQEEARQKRIEEAKRKQEEQKRLEEEKRRQAEELKQKQEEEAKLKKEQQAKKMAEQKAAVAVRRVIQKIRVATPETLEELTAELEASLELEAENLGSQLQQMRDECGKAKTLAAKRVENIETERKKAEEKKAEEERLRLEKEQKVKELLVEFTVIVDEAEASTGTLKEASQKFEAGADMTMAKVEEASQAVEAAFQSAKVMTKKCAEFVASRQADLKDPLGRGGAPLSEAQQETKKQMAALLTRVQDYNKSIESTLSTARAGKDKATKRALANEKTAALRRVFDKYDADSDGALSQKEISSYALAEFNCKVSQEALDDLLRRSAEDNGVKFDNFLDVRTAIGIARETQRDAARRAEKAAKEAHLEKMRAKLAEEVQAIVPLMEAAESEVAACEKDVAEMKARAKAAAPPEVVRLVGELEAKTTVAKASTAAARAGLDGLGADLEGSIKEELQGFLSEQVKKHDGKLGRMGPRILRTENLCKQFREEAVKKQANELSRLRAGAVKVLRYNQRIKQLNCNQLFDDIDKNGDGEIDEKEFVDWFEGADKTIREAGVPAEEEEAPPPAAEAEEPEEGEGKAAEEADGEAEAPAAEERGEGEEGAAAADGAEAAGAEAAGEEEGAAEKGEEEDVEMEPAAKKEPGDEMAACVAIRRGVAKLRAATAETFDDRKTELEEILKVEIENTGSRRDAITSEVEKGIELARQRLERLAAQKGKEGGKALAAAAAASEEATAAAAGASATTGAAAAPAGGAARKKEPETVVLSAEDAARLHALLCEDGASTLSRDVFLRFIRVYMTAVKEVVLTPDKNVSSGGKPIRRVALKEVIEVLQGPLLDESTGLLRVEGRAFKDGAEGWITATGNKGTPFLAEGGDTWKVSKEIVLTEAFDIGEDKGADGKKLRPRKLKVGEVLDMLEWPRKEPNSGLMRMRVRVRSDRTLGWVTSTGNAGTAFVDLQ